MTSSATESEAASALAVWSPSVYTSPLTGELLHTDGDRLLDVLDHIELKPEAPGTFKLDDWQRWLIRHVLEVYPPDHPRAGQLRYRQCVISMGRQNGKSELAAVFGLYALLLQCTNPQVVSVASSVDQANIIFKRVKNVVDNTKYLKGRFKTTATRGIASRDVRRPGSYIVKAGAEASLQGLPITMCLFDEIHICKPETWDAIRFGTSAQPSAMILGITTAGDENSVLLKRLYETGKQAAVQEGDYDDRFGFFLWEAPAHLGIYDPDALRAANPAIACGRIDVDQEIQALKSMPENQVRRYRLNQFVAAESTWLPMSMWQALERGPLPDQDKVVFAVERALNWEFATITAAKRVGNRVYTEVVASLVAPDHDQLEEICVQLWKEHSPDKFFMPSATLKVLADRLRERHVRVEYLTVTQMLNVCATAYSLIAEKRVVVNTDPLVDAQVPKGVAKNTGEGWRLSARDSIGEIDALMATLIGMYAAEITKPPVRQMLVF